MRVKGGFILGHGSKVSFDVVILAKHFSMFWVSNFVQNFVYNKILLTINIRCQKVGKNPKKVQFSEAALIASKAMITIFWKNFEWSLQSEDFFSKNHLF